MFEKFYTIFIRTIGMLSIGLVFTISTCVCLETSNITDKFVCGIALGVTIGIFIMLTIHTIITTLDE